MNKWWGLALGWLVLCAGSVGAALPPAPAVSVRPVIVVTLDGAIGPATADHVHRALAQAVKQQAQLVVLQIDTPGGLDVSMRRIIKDILSSPIPVASFVAPTGARAASAGAYIVYASHIAAMAPATNLGAATPVAIGMPTPGGSPEATPPRRGNPASSAEAGAPEGDVMSAKRLSDAAAYIRSLAQLRGRNADWAEKAVRESVSLSAQEALKLKVIDLLAQDVPDLVRQLDGRDAALPQGRVHLATHGATIVPFEADARTRFLSVITDPSLALILLMIGVYGLLFEFMSPGLVLPGVAGAICLLLALFALQMLPVNYAGLGLILLAVLFFVAEAFVPSFGTLGLGGIIAFAAGAVLLIDEDVAGYGIPRALIAALTLVSAAFVLIVAGMAAKARRRPVVSGTSALVGVAGEVIEFAGGEGWATVQGEPWRVRADTVLQPGDRVQVVGAAGALLQVAPAPESKASTTTGE